MALTQQQADRVREKMDAEMIRVVVEGRQGEVIEADAPLGGITYMQIQGVEDLVAMLGFTIYRIESDERGRSVMRLRPKVQQ